MTNIQNDGNSELTYSQRSSEQKIEIQQSVYANENIAA